MTAKADESSPSGYAQGQPITQQYALQRRLATTESGEVWVALDRSTGETVAIKLVQASGPAASHFRREAELSATLVHANIVRVLGSFEASGNTLGLVMEYLHGETARERVDRAGPLSPRAAVEVITQTLAGLAHAHGQSIVHRNLKPSNLFLASLASDRDGRTTAKILDFGVAYTDSNTIQTLQGQMVGTPQYMSPEQIRATDVLDARSDLFSLGTVLYELLTGKCPFAASFQMGSLAAVLEAKVERHERIPPALWEVIAQTLSKRRDARPATAIELAAALHAAMEADDPSPSRAVPRSTPPPPPIVFPTPPAPKPSSPRSRGARVRERAIFLVAGVIGISLTILAVAALQVPRSRLSASAPVEAPPLLTPLNREPPALPETAKPPSTSTTASAAAPSASPLSAPPPTAAPGAAAPGPLTTGAAPAKRSPRAEKEPPSPAAHEPGF